MIELNNVSKRFGRRTALANVTLTLAAGDVTLLCGANGAGKSTLLRCLLGITDYEGQITIDGLDPLAEGERVRSLVGYMPQTGGLHPDLTVEATMSLFAAIRGASPDRCTALLESAGLSNHSRTLVGELSGGMRQRLGFVLALLSDPRILVLDEPSSSLDAASRAWLARSLRTAAAEGRTVILSTHAGQDLLSAGDRRIVLEDGRVVEDERLADRPSAVHPRALAAAPRPASAWPIAGKEIRDAVGNRWLIGYALLLAVLGLAAHATANQATAGLALQAFGRTTATLMNLCLLLSPLVAVLMGAGAIAGERERGSLEHLLAQPYSRTRLLLAKHLGLLASLTAATWLGFLPAGLAILASAGPEVAARYLLFPLLASAVGGALAAVGLVISVSSRSAVQAQGIALFTWFVFVLLYDLLLIGSIAFGSVPTEAAAAALVANPVDAGRVLGILALEPDLYLLGPAGAYLTERLSPAGAAATLLVAVVLWTTVPVIAAARAFRLRPVRVKSFNALPRVAVPAAPRCAVSPREEASVS